MSDPDPPPDPASKESEDPELPEADHYRFVSEIARGGMGIVFRGRDTELSRDVALKVIHGKMSEKSAMVDRFVEEAQIGGQLQHPGIVPVYELGKLADDRPFFAMKLVRGDTLSKLLKNCVDRQQEQRRFLAIFEAVCQTMAYAHSRGVIHRDLKPSNVMVGSFGEVQLVDWGLAKVINAPSESPPPTAEQAEEVSAISTIRSGGMETASHSVAGSVMGTVAYMSPEQARGDIDELDERTDVFALGGVLCEILTGRPPYPGKREKSIPLAVEPDQRNFHARLDSCGADAVLVQLARDCLAPERSERPDDAGVVAGRIASHLASVEERARAAMLTAAEERGKAQQERRARRLTVSLAFSAVLTILVAAGAFAWFERDRDQRRSLTAERVADALSDAVFACSRSAWAEAETALAQADAHLETGVAGAGLRARVQEEREAYELALEQARQVEEREERRDEFMREVERVRARVGRTNEGKIEAYGELFRGQGVPVDESSDGLLIEAIAGSGAEVEMARALVDWARLVREAAGGNTEESRRLIRIALAVDDHVDRSRLRSAVLEEDRARIEAVASELADVELDPMTAIDLADALWWSFLEDQAIAVLERAEQRRPNDFHLQVKLATRYGNRAQTERAFPHMKVAEALSPESIWVLSNLSMAYLVREDLERALDYGRRAVELDEGNAFAQHHYAASLWANDERELAIEHLQFAIDIAPDYVFALQRMGIWLEELGESHEASEWFARAIELDTNDSDMLNRFAWHLATATDGTARAPEEALRLAELATRHDKSAAKQNTLGVCLYRTAAYERSHDALMRSIAATPGESGTPEDWLFAAMASGQLGEAERAEREYERGLERIESIRATGGETAEVERYRLEAAELLGL